MCVVGFSEASMSKRNPFYSDVFNILVSLVGEEDFIDTVIESPYGYGIRKNLFSFCSKLTVCICKFKQIKKSTIYTINWLQCT